MLRSEALHGGAFLSRLARWWRREANRPGTLVQVLCLGGITTLTGLLGVAGAFGASASLRWLGALITMIGVLLVVLALHRLRR